MSPRTGGEETRARLRSAATRCFAERGFAATRVSDVVREAGLTQAAFYLYFASKQAVYEEIVEGFRARLLDQIRSWQPDPELPVGLVPAEVHRNLLALLDFLQVQAEETRLVLQDPELGEGVRRELAVALEGVLHILQPAGRLRPELDVRITAEALLGMLERLTVRYVLSGEKTPREVADAVFVLILHGLHSLPEV